MAQKEVLLSPRETQIVRLLLDGHDSSSAAKFLQVSETTVRNHLTRLCRKCDVKDSSELIGLQWFMRLAVLVDGSERVRKHVLDKEPWPAARWGGS